MANFVRAAALFSVLICLSVEQALAAAAVPTGLPPSAVLLLRYDANQDSAVTRAEMEAGLKTAYDAANTNHDSCLDRPEMRTENERRLRQDAGQASPLNDWNLDGCVDMTEFSSTVRSYFNFADRTKNDEVSLVELRGPSMPIPLPGAKNPDGSKSTDPGVSY